jgi:hypothetical protein
MRAGDKHLFGLVWAVRPHAEREQNKWPASKRAGHFLWYGFVMPLIYR